MLQGTFPGRPGRRLLAHCAAIERVLDDQRDHCSFVDPAQSFPLSLKLTKSFAGEDRDRLASSL
jgi:hypothetical protein